MKSRNIELETKQEYVIKNKREENIKREGCKNARECNVKDKIGDPCGRRTCVEVRETERGK